MFTQGNLIEVKPVDTILKIWHYKKGIVEKEITPRFYRVTVEMVDGFKELVLHENEMMLYDNQREEDSNQREDGDEFRSYAAESLFGLDQS